MYEKEYMGRVLYDYNWICWAIRVYILVKDTFESSPCPLIVGITLFHEVWKFPQKFYYQFLSVIPKFWGTEATSPNALESRCSRWLSVVFRTGMKLKDFSFSSLCTLLLIEKCFESIIISLPTLTFLKTKMIVPLSPFCYIITEWSIHTGSRRPRLIPPSTWEASAVT